MYLSAEKLHNPEVSPVVMNYKTRHNKNRPARDSLVWPDHFPLLIFVVEVYIMPVPVMEILIFTILPALAVGCTGKGRFGVSSRLHWKGSSQR